MRSKTSLLSYRWISVILILIFCFGLLGLIRVEKFITAQEIKSANLIDFVSQRIDSQRNIILIYASFSYKLPLMNWLISIAQLPNIRNIGIICLDAELHDYLASMGETCLKLDDLLANKNESQLDLESVKKLWVIRSEHVLDLLRAKINVIVSDSDAIWLQDPFASGLFSGADGVLVGGKGRFPYHSKWGAALCMGVVYIKSTPGMIILAEEALVYTRKTKDDQIGFNTALSLSKGGSDALAFGRIVSAVDDQPARARIGDDGDVVRLVEHKLIPRECQLVKNWKAVVIAHCHVNDGVPATTNKNKGNQKSHLDVLIKYSLFNLVNKNWEKRLKEFLLNGKSFWDALILLGNE